MKITAKVNFDDSLHDFEFEGTLAEIRELPNVVERLKQSLKVLVTKQD